MEPKDFIEELRAFAEEGYKLENGEYVLKAKELFLKAHAQITSLSDLVEEKSHQLERRDSEKKLLAERLREAVESEKKAYERLADIDISRHAEVADLKRELENLKGSASMFPGDGDKAVKELEVKRLQLAESEANLLKASETVRALEAELAKLIKESEEAAEVIEALGDQTQEIPGDDTDKEEIKRRDAEINDLKKQLARSESVEGKLKEEAEALSRENSRLLARISDAEAGHSDDIDSYKSRAAHMEGDINVLKAEVEKAESSLIEKIKEADEFRAELKAKEASFERLTEEKDSLIAALRKEAEERSASYDELTDEIKTLKEKLSGAESLAESLRAEKDALRDEMGDLSGGLQEAQKRISALHAGEVKPKKSGIGRALAAGLVLFLMALGGVTVALSTQGRLKAVASAFLGGMPPVAPKAPEPAALPQADALSQQAPPPWTGSREFMHEDFSFTITYLTPDLMQAFEIVPKVTPAEKDGNHFYAVEIKSGRSCIPDDILNAPQKSFSVIDKGGSLVSPALLPSLDASKKAIYRTGACSGSTGAVFFRYFLTVPKSLATQGIVVESLIGNSPLIIK